LADRLFAGSMNAGSTSRMLLSRTRRCLLEKEDQDPGLRRDYKGAFELD